MIATSTSGTNRQQEIYTNGFAGNKSLVPIDAKRLEEAAVAAMSPEASGYIIGGAGNESDRKSVV